MSSPGHLTDAGESQFIRSHSHNAIRSTPKETEQLLCNSFNNGSAITHGHNISDNALESLSHLSINNNLINHRPPTNLNSSSISLPPSNLNHDPSLKSSPIPNSHVIASKRINDQTSRSSLPTTHSSQLPLQQATSFNNTSNLTPSRRMINIIEERLLIPPTGVANPVPNIMHITKKSNCSPNIMRCTLNSVPMNEDLLNKTHLPLAILLHPFRDLPSLQVIRSKKIIRCRNLSCRAYINPFVSFTDQKRWKCNMCLRMNELSDESIYNQATGEYFDTLRRFELRLPTVEYIAPKEYSLKTTQVPVYVFLIDISYHSTNGLYPNTVGKILNTIEQLLDRMPGYQNAKVAFIGYDSAIHFYTISDRGFQELVVTDLSNPMEIPVTSGIVVDLNVYHDTIQELLTCLMDNVEDESRCQVSSSCLGTALLVAKDLFSNNCGGRVTVFNASCPTIGEGVLVPRKDHKTSNVLPLAPDKEFYKTMSLEFAQAQIAVDLFQLGTVPCDLASLSIITRYCSGSLFYYPDLSYTTHPSPDQTEVALNELQRLVTDLHRYLTRKIGFEGVLRLRFSSGFNILSSHGNFFARASDLFSMANVNPDSGIAIRLGIEDNFIDTNLVFVQAALLYTSSVGERRIRVHTLCLPVSTQIDDLFRMADHQSVAALLAKTVADRVQNSGNVIEAREALLNAVIDPSIAFGKFCLSSSQRLTSLPLPYHLRMLPLYVWGMLQSPCLKATKNNVDLSVSILDSWRNHPLSYLIVDLYPNLYNLIGIIDLNSRQKEMFPSIMIQDEEGDEEEDEKGVDRNSLYSSEEEEEEEEEDQDSTEDGSSWESEPGSNISCYNSRLVPTVRNSHVEEEEFWYPAQVHLSAQSLTRAGVYLLDHSSGLILVLGADTPRTFLRLIFGIDNLRALTSGLSDLPDLHNPCSAHLRVFIRELQVERPLGSSLFVVANDRSVLQRAFLSQLIEDDQANASYQRFLQHVQKKINGSGH